VILFGPKIAGEGEVKVPKVIGLLEAEGHQIISEVGLSYMGTTYQTPGDIGPKDIDYFLSFSVGQIVSQNPLPGAIVKKGTGIHIAVRKE
jgi:hypothetical protein